MPPYEKQQLEEVVKLTKENNKMLRSMARAAWWSRLFVILKWIVIIALTLGVYYYLEPVLKNLLSVYTSLGGVDIGKFQDIIQNIKPQ